MVLTHYLEVAVTAVRVAVTVALLLPKGRRGSHVSLAQMCARVWQSTASVQARPRVFFLLSRALTAAYKSEADSRGSLSYLAEKEPGKINS